MQMRAVTTPNVKTVAFSVGTRGAALEDALASGLAERMKLTIEDLRAFARA